MVESIFYDDRQIADAIAALLGWESGISIGWQSPEMAEYDEYEFHRNLQDQE
jgi:hypothetical protein